MTSCPERSWSRNWHSQLEHILFHGKHPHPANYGSKAQWALANFQELEKTEWFHFLILFTMVVELGLQGDINNTSYDVS
jgi:hypothetical protein